MNSQLFNMSMAKPTVLVTTSTFPRWQKDNEPRFVYDLSKRLATEFNIIILAPHATGAAIEEQWDGMQIYRYRYAPEKWQTLTYNGGISANLKQDPWKFLLLPLFFLGQWWALRKVLHHYNVDTIHTHWLIPQGLVAAFTLLVYRKNIKLVCTSHGGDLFGLQGKISTFLKRWVINHCHAITVVSQAMLLKAKELTHNQYQAIHVIPMGTDLTHTFVPNPNIKRAANQLLFVGRLVEKKGLTYLLQALQQLQPNFPNLELIIAGSGPLKDQLIQQTQQLGIAHQVKFVGRLTHTELVMLYQTATLAVFPFIQTQDGDMEGLGLVMVEAMGCGCPVIASDLPAVRDVINHGDNGILVEPNNSRVLAVTIKDFFQFSIKNELIDSMTILKKFDWLNIVDLYKNIIKK
ncbi:MAG: glycosyltransferase [Candidatus Thiocaldithrix dubininis]|uniref:Glycosyltransferase n=1 Tax=Candidatus Thiocaldithrix dubininis TaxID=3080823 RepID=A0AA95H5J5_9GAMM|nr:MAG: glycosyltransferase [Candidatus Thiocaldithrix dubininis]